MAFISTQIFVGKIGEKSSTTFQECQKSPLAAKIDILIKIRNSNDIIQVHREKKKCSTDFEPILFFNGKVIKHMKQFSEWIHANPFKSVKLKPEWQKREENISAKQFGTFVFDLLKLKYESLLSFLFLSWPFKNVKLKGT